MGNRTQTPLDFKSTGFNSMRQLWNPRYTLGLHSEDMSLALKATHATVKAYYDTLGQFGQLHIDHEMAVRSAFQDLLAKSGRKAKPPLTLVPEYRIERARGSSVIVDGALVDLYHLPHGYWEAKDEKDDLAKEVQFKLDKGYPRDNIIFQAPERAILYQGGARVFDENISRPESLVEVVNQFFDYKAPHIQEWEQAVGDFSERIPELAAAVKKTIDVERRQNPAFVHSFDDFYALCRQAINPNLSEEAVERMLVQHLLTERIFRKIFANPDFTRRNVVAAEIEKVITELTKRAFNRDEFLGNLDRFYKAIEQSAENATSFSEKQAFLNKVYERFFQGYSPKEADTHGIVYTPQPIVNFMVRSVEEILQKEFGRSLGDKGVHILDPFVGTGNFIVRIMQEIKATDLQYKYENELHCNEVMLLPYYIASMNIEHAYFDRTDEYKPFPGICLVDTFELAESKQVPMFTERNTERVERQKQQQIFVIIGNPPYNAGQVNENDNNRNRKYPVIDSRVSETYGRSSKATLLRKLQDPYVKAFRWATDRIGDEGIVAFVSNSSFVHERSMDGMRARLAKEFDAIYTLDLGGNVYKNPKLSGTTHNVFGIKVGVSINLLVRRSKKPNTTIRYAAAGADWRKEQKYNFLQEMGSATEVGWAVIQPDSNQTWVTTGLATEFKEFLPLADTNALFCSYLLGFSTNRDETAIAFSGPELTEKVKKFCRGYSTEVSRQLHEPDGNLDDGIKWSETLKLQLKRGVRAKFDSSKIRQALYRPFTTEFVYYDDVVVDRPSHFERVFPQTVNENIAACLTGPGSDKPFVAMATRLPVDLHLVGAGCTTQCFPFYTYAEDGTHRRENITDWALEQFRTHYHDPSITKWDIFHYIYAVLHHPEYRERYAANLRRELPRIPFACYVGFSPTRSSRAEHEGPKDSRAESRDPMPAGTQQRRRKEFPPRNAADSVSTPERPYEKLSAEAKERVLSQVKAMQEAGEVHYVSQDDARVFRAFAKSGQRLAEIHVHYEQQPEYKLTKVEKAGEKLDYRVTKMKLSKDKTTLIYNQFLTLSGIPRQTYDYRLGNRSALEWVIDQYQASTDKRSGITNDPNRADDPTYILRLIGQIVTVSLETVETVRSLPSLGLEQD